MRFKFTLGVTVLLVTACAGLTSCGYYVKEERLPETGATLEGTITYGNEKVPVALIIVAGTNSSAQGHVDEVTGRYSVANVPLGPVKIGVNVKAAEGEMTGKMMSGWYQGPEAKKQGIVAPPKVVNIPTKYFEPNTSGITTTINAGNNTFDIKITK
jgi:hypothetical protein